MKWNLVIVDNHSLFRNGLKVLLRTTMNDYLGEIYEAESGPDLLRLTERCSFDVALMDIAMPEMSGIEATTRLLRICPQVKVIALTMFREHDYYLQMIHAGASGFLVKDAEITEVKEAILSVMEGGEYFPGSVLIELLKREEQAAVKDKAAEHLSDREVEVISLICKGLSNQEMADQLFLSKRTIDNHRANILEKTGCRNTASLVIWAVKNRIVEV
ncbi:MAG: response regulator [Bacteroidota bacterium]